MRLPDLRGDGWSTVSSVNPASIVDSQFASYMTDNALFYFGHGSPGVVVFPSFELFSSDLRVIGASAISLEISLSRPRLCQVDRIFTGCFCLAQIRLRPTQRKIPPTLLDRPLPKATWQTHGIRSFIKQASHYARFLVIGSLQDRVRTNTVPTPEREIATSPPMRMIPSRQR